MTDVKDLQELEKLAFRRFFEDGIFDIFLGLMLVLMPLVSFTGDRVDNEGARIALLIVAYGGLVAATQLVRRHLLRTRLGDFRPGAGRRRKIRNTRLVLLGSVALGIVAFVVAGAMYTNGGSVEVLDVAMPILWFVNATVVFGAMAYFLDVPRLAVYGLLFGSALLLAEAPRLMWGFDVPLWLAFGLPAGIIIVAGIRKLIVFLRDYPVQPTGRAFDGSE
jgi:hypothetical protein